MGERFYENVEDGEKTVENENGSKTVENVEDEKERKRQAILKKVEEYHRNYTNLWLSHLKNRGR